MADPAPFSKKLELRPERTQVNAFNRKKPSFLTTFSTPVESIGRSLFNRMSINALLSMYCIFFNEPSVRSLYLTPKTAAMEKFKGDLAGGRRSASPKIRSEGAVDRSYCTTFSSSILSFFPCLCKLTTTALVSFSAWPCAPTL
jgi:hypothetical protein